MQHNLILGDCLKVMPTLETGSIDMILVDVPYGITQCKWDSIIPLEPMWEQLKRLIKPNRAIVMTASQPFTTKLISSNYKMFKYCWIWEKSNISGFVNAKKQPLRCNEDVIVFYKKSSLYNPQGLIRINKTRKNSKNCGGDILRSNIETSKNKGNLFSVNKDYMQEFTGYPKNIIYFKSERGFHPTQKPVALMEYLIKTYTNKGDTVLDFTMGSGTTGVACKNLNRKFIGIEKKPQYYYGAVARLC